MKKILLLVLIIAGVSITSCNKDKNAQAPNEQTQEVKNQDPNFVSRNEIAKMDEQGVANAMINSIIVYFADIEALLKKYPTANAEMEKEYHSIFETNKLRVLEIGHAMKGKSPEELAKIEALMEKSNSKFNEAMGSYTNAIKERMQDIEKYKSGLSLDMSLDFTKLLIYMDLNKLKTEMPDEAKKLGL